MIFIFPAFQWLGTIQTLSKFVSETLSIPICVDETICDKSHNTLFIMGCGPSGSVPFTSEYLREALALAVRKAKRIVFLKNDYTMKMTLPTDRAGSALKSALRDNKDKIRIWSTCDNPGEDYVNLNCASFIPFTPTPKRHDCLLYYGNFRDNRAIYFDQYFGDPKMETVLSYSANKQHNIHFIKYDKVVHIPTVPLHSLGEYAYGLYLEDTVSHVKYHSPAARFYEMMSVGLPILFQPEALQTMNHGGYSLRNAYMINGLCGINRDDILLAQHSDWMKLIIKEVTDTKLRMKELAHA